MQLSKTGISLAAALLLTQACGSGDSSNNTDQLNDSSQNNETQNNETQNNETQNDETQNDETQNDTGNSESGGTDPSTTDNANNTDNTNNNSESGSDTSGDSQTDTGQTGDNNNQSENTDLQTGNGEGTVVPNSGVDLSGGDDDSPTTTESLSLQGPFVKNTGRPYGPPSTPYGLTMLLQSDNWVRFSWVPSTDDQSVEGYEIYRDGQHIHTVRGDTNYEFDYRNWLSTAYMDCDYTHYATCRDTQPASGATYQYQIVAVDNEGMKSAASAPVQFTLEQKSTGGVDLTGYRKVFEDNFNGSTLDRNLWKTALPWGEYDIINGERQFFVNVFSSDPLPVSPFHFTGETMQIVGSKTPDELLSRAANQPYLSGVITTADHFNMLYGYVEMRARMAAGSGILSTFYLFNQTFERNKPEIDIVELMGSDPTVAHQTYHYYDSNRARWGDGEKHSTPTMHTETGTDLTAGFHTYSVLWEPGRVTWYLDGSEVRRMSGPRVSDEPMNIVANLVLGSEWIGNPDDASLPARLEIDYIRAYQK